MTGPIDIIREALTTAGPYLARLNAALAALTEVEHQLAAGRQDEQIEADVGEHYREERDQERARAVAAETALAEANQRIEELRELEARMRLRGDRWMETGEAAERRANDLETKLRQIADDMLGVLKAQSVVDAPSSRSEVPTRVLRVARAALDRHTQ